MRQTLAGVPHQTIRGYLAHKKHPPPQDPTVGLCLGTYGDPVGLGVCYERGTLPCIAEVPFLVLPREELLRAASP